MNGPATPAPGAVSGPDERSFVERRGINPMLFAFGALAAVFVLYQFVGGVLTFLVTGSSVTASNVATVRALTLFGQLALILVPVILFARLLAVRLSDVFPLRRPSWLEATYALVGLFALQRLLEVYQTFQDQLPLPEVLRQVLAPLKEMFESLVRLLVGASSVPELLVVIVVVAAVPAVVEELMFRGLIQRAFEQVMSPVVAAVFAGTIFGLFHLNPFEAVPLIVIGVYFGILRHRSQTMLLPMAAHFVNNLLAVLSYYFGFEQAAPGPAAPAAPGTLIVQFAFFGALFAATFLGYLRTTEEWRTRLRRGGA